ncbi:haloacid dehalogenase-like hydrolase [Vibrio fortis]|uniref:haloacid dehalogenase-like hydrolase n=1 Tax=Vibrio fortis TaxID=212667 RepID=UPI003EB9C04B
MIRNDILRKINHLNDLNKGKVKICYFDLCDTLVSCNTTVTFIEKYYMSDLKKKCYKNIFLRGLNKLAFRLFKFDAVRWLYLRELKGISRTTLDSQAKDFVQNCNFNQEIIEILDYLHKNEWCCYIVSASLDFLVSEFAYQLKMKVLGSTALLYNNNTCEGVILFDLLDKKDRLDYPNADGTIFISDNKGDRKIMECMNYGIAVSKEKNSSYWRSFQGGIIKL